MKLARPCCWRYTLSCLSYMEMEVTFIAPHNLWLVFHMLNPSDKQKDGHDFSQTCSSGDPYVLLCEATPPKFNRALVFPLPAIGDINL